MKKQFQKTVTLDDLAVFCENFRDEFEPGDVVSLEAEMGGGKTTLLRCLLQSLGMADDEGFSSPTFSILNQYDCDGVLINHVDLYRLSDFEELENTDILAEFTKDRISFIEWGNKFAELNSLYNKKIILMADQQDPEERLISFFKR
ncbi:MAG: tRNA (adenosine(37)-N6)-threonylcarbamoyltransferase complex ATPase subunit type 1 TsaE [Deltaproteobacteria bacterium]|nr:tRNA (adenosine(37)-N6)-threonylcarbamoyltransferase complex ATPase subunit type 1 TsaE [Deltaproteobacteria bacterium]